MPFLGSTGLFNVEGFKGEYGLLAHPDVANHPAAVPADQYHAVEPDDDGKERKEE